VTTPGAPHFLARALRRSFDGGAWHGPSLAESLAGVDVHAARARPIADGHTIWELTHHVAAWTREVARRLEGAALAMPAEGDWPSPAGATDAAAWDALRAELVAARDAVLAALGTFPAARLDARVSDGGAPALGATATWGQMIVGLAEHNAYHGGQIVLLRRLVDGTRLAGYGPRPDPETITES
jgi:uncharacterized damage-inducible protein DinB